MIFIGIDPGEHTGVAIWDSNKRAFVLLVTVPLHRALKEVYMWATAPELAGHRAGRKVHVVCEDARLRKWIPRDPSYSRMKGRLQGAGSIKRDSTIWEEFLSDPEVAMPWAADRGVTFTLCRPTPGGTKWSAEQFAKVTGYTGRTSNHARDAALKVFGLKTTKAPV